MVVLLWTKKQRIWIVRRRDPQREAHRRIVQDRRAPAATVFCSEHATRATAPVVVHARADEGTLHTHVECQRWSDQC